MKTSTNTQMDQCIANCMQCYQVCLETAMNHCLEKGGQHTEPEHFRTMMNCAEICRTSAHFMLSGSDLHRLTCATCAEVCARCAESCESLEGMESCAAECRRCAESCKHMAA
jgi:hypothetical protein